MIKHKLFLLFLFLLLITFNYCLPQDWVAFNNDVVDGYCDHSKNAEQENNIGNQEKKLGQKAQRTVHQKLTSDTFRSSDYPGFNPILKWGSQLSSEDKENIKLAIIKAKIIVNLDVFKKALETRHKKHPFQAKPFITDPKMPQLPHTPKTILDQILNFTHPPYVEYIKKELKKATIIERTNLTNVPTATGGYEKIELHNNGALIRCNNPLPYVMLHEFLHIMNHNHGLDPSVDIAIQVGNIVQDIHYAVSMPKIPEFCYKGEKTEYDC